MGKKNKSKAPKGRAGAKKKAKKGGGGGAEAYGDWTTNFIRATRQMSDDDDGIKVVHPSLLPVAK